MQFAVIYTSFAVMGSKVLHSGTWRYMALHGVTWRYINLHGVTYFFRLSCGIIAVSGCNW
jgi:hypothetical protein